MSWKYIYFTETSAESQIDFLRKRYNTKSKVYYFKNGKYKDRSCIYVLNDLITKTYGEPIPSKQHPNDLFFPPLNPLVISDYEILPDKKEWKIKVDLVEGTTLWIVPATLEPKKIVFDFDDNTGVTEENSPYSLATEYGTLAFSIFEDVQAKKDIMLNDKRIKKLILLAIQKSYSIPLDIINSCGIISSQDIDPLLSACLGINPELLEKKSDG